jgi:hypothetical protein
MRFNNFTQTFTIGYTPARSRVIPIAMAQLQVDVCVIGNELSGFAAAALLAHMGQRVIVIDNQEPYETRLLGEYFAPTFPHIWQIPKSGPAALVLEKLELRAQLRQCFGLKGDIGFANDPHERLIASSEPLKLRTELARVFGNDEANRLVWALENFESGSRDALFHEVSMLDEKGFWAGLRTKKRVTKAGQVSTLMGSTKSTRGLCDGSLTPYLSAVLPYLQYQSSLSLDSYGGHLALKALTGTAALPGFMHASSYATLKSIFAESLLRHGGEILQADEIQSIGTHKNSILNIKLKGRNSYSPAVVIDASYRRELPALLSDKDMANRLIEHENQVLPSGHTYILRMLLPRTALSKALPPITTSFWNESGAHHQAVLGVFNPWKKPSLHQSFDTQLESERAIAVLAMWTDAPNVQDTHKALEEHVNRLLPFALESCIHKDLIRGDEANFIWPQFVSSGKNLNAFMGRSLHTPIANVLRAGRDVAPALGVDGEITVALAATKAAHAMLHKPERSLFGLKTRPIRRTP